MKIACGRLRWGEGFIEPGQPVPEDEPGRNYALMHHLGQIEDAQDEVIAAPISGWYEPRDPAELSKLKRAELNELARRTGVPDPHALASKAAVIQAIAAAGG